MVTWEFGDEVPRVVKPRREPARRRHRKQESRRTVKTELESVPFYMRGASKIFFMFIVHCSCGYATKGALNELGALKTMDVHLREMH